MFSVFIQNNKQSLLATLLSGFLEIDPERAQKLVNDIVSAGFSPTVSDDSTSVVKELSTALCGTDDTLVRDKCFAFLSKYRDIRVCQSATELDSRSLFSALSRKLIQFVQQDQEELLTLLVMVLVRLVQRRLLFLHFRCLLL